MAVSPICASIDLAKSAQHTNQGKKRYALQIIISSIVARLLAGGLSG
jgi:hypothetical protein